MVAVVKAPVSIRLAASSANVGQGLYGARTERDVTVSGWFLAFSKLV